MYFNRTTQKKILVLVVLILMGACAVFKQSTDEVEVDRKEYFEKIEEAVTKERAPKLIEIYITGAVARPGIYKARAGTKVREVLPLAGGFLPNADLTKLNLIRKCRDGLHIRVPYIRVKKEKIRRNKEEERVGAMAKTPAYERAQWLTKATEYRDSRRGQIRRGRRRKNAASKVYAGTNAGAAKAFTKRVNINRAKAEELAELPGIDYAQAKAIVRYRWGHTFIHRKGLIHVPGMTKRKLKNIEHLVEV